MQRTQAMSVLVCHPATGLVLIQEAVDGSVKAAVAAEHVKGCSAGAEAADADMADASDEAEDGVTPQKRKTSPQDVVSDSCDSCASCCGCVHWASVWKHERCPQLSRTEPR